MFSKVCIYGLGAIGGWMGARLGQLPGISLSAVARGETLAEGAARETHEEAGAHIEMGPLFSVINVVKVGQVHFFYQARLLNLDFDPGHET